MPAADAERANRLDRHLDALLRDAEPPDDQLDADLAATLLHLHTLSFRPVPDPAFVHRLNEELANRAGDTTVASSKPESASPHRVILRNCADRGHG